MRALLPDRSSAVHESTGSTALLRLRQGIFTGPGPELIRRIVVYLWAQQGLFAAIRVPDINRGIPSAERTALEHSEFRFNQNRL